MHKLFVFVCLVLLLYVQSLLSQVGQLVSKDTKIEEWKSIVVETRRLKFDLFPKAYNPSLAHTNLGLLLSFRYLPMPDNPWISQIGIVRLDENTMMPLGEPQILQTRLSNSKTPSQAEDARVFFCNGKTYIIYNDNIEIVNPLSTQRRDMFIAQIDEIDHLFVMSEPIKLYHYDQYPHVKWQKNWVPFEWQGIVLFNYSIHPHEILYPNFDNGKCISFALTKMFNNWQFGTLRGGTPALMVDGEYLSFFHSTIKILSPVSTDAERHHYFMGAYTFSAEPPFHITKITSLPIVAKDFYHQSDAEKRIIFPGGYFIKGPYLHVAYGKDDREIWIATIDKDLLKANLVPVQEYVDDNVLPELFDFTKAYK